MEKSFESKITQIRERHFSQKTNLLGKLPAFTDSSKFDLKMSELEILFCEKNENDLMEDMSNIQKYLDSVSQNFIELYKSKKIKEESVKILEAFDKFPDLTKKIEKAVGEVLSLKIPPLSLLTNLKSDIELYQSILHTLGETYCDHLKKNLSSLFSLLWNNLSDFLVENNNKNPESTDLASQILQLVSTDLQPIFMTKSDSHFQKEINSEKSQLQKRVKSLGKYSASFISEGDSSSSSYTFLFSEIVSSVLGELVNMTKSAKRMRVFLTGSRNCQNGCEWIAKLENQLVCFLGEIVIDFKSFFEFEYDIFMKETKEMFILIDHPYQKQKKDGVADKFDIHKLQIFITEMTKIIRVAADALTEIRSPSRDSRKDTPTTTGYLSNTLSLVDDAVAPHQPFSNSLPVLEIWLIEQNQFIKSVVETVTKLQLIVTVRDSSFLRLIFFSSQEPQCMFDIERELLNGTFDRLDWNKFGRGVYKRHIFHETINFTKSNEWVYSIFDFLEAMSRNVFSLMEEKSIVSFLSFASNVILNKDVKGLLAKLTELSIRKDLFGWDGFCLESINMKIYETVFFKEAVQELILKKQSIKSRLFSRSNLMFASLVKMYETVENCLEKFEFQLKVCWGDCKKESKIVESTIEEISVVKRDFENKKKSILFDFSEKSGDIFARKYLEKFRNSNLSVLKFNNEQELLDDMIRELENVMELFEFYLSYDNLEIFKNHVFEKILGCFREIVIAKNYNMKGGCYVKYEYAKLKESVVKHCGSLSELRSLDFIVELVSAIDKDYFDNFGVLAEESLQENEIRKIRKLRIDFD